MTRLVFHYLGKQTIWCLIFQRTDLCSGYCFKCHFRTSFATYSVRLTESDSEFCNCDSDITHDVADVAAHARYSIRFQLSFLLDSADIAPTIAKLLRCWTCVWNPTDEKFSRRVVTFTVSGREQSVSQVCWHRASFVSARQSVGLLNTTTKDGLLPEETHNNLTGFSTPFSARSR